MLRCEVSGNFFARSGRNDKKIRRPTCVGRLQNLRVIALLLYALLNFLPVLCGCT